MKENEIEDGKVLMIGDLVIGCIETDIVDEATYKIPCRVTNINNYGDVTCEALEPFPDGLDWQDGDDFSWIEAIPLTIDMLLHSGFELQEQGGERFDLWTGFGEDNQHDIEVEFNNDKPLHLKIDGPVYLATTHIEYVHQLQHFLRDCGIEHEIKL